jgi:hypothetical protein
VLGGRAVRVSQEMIDRLCDTPDKNQLLHVGGGFTVIYGPDGARIGDRAPVRGGARGRRHSMGDPTQN